MWFWMSSCACVVAALAIQFTIFGNSFKTRSSTNVVTFFFVHELVRKRERHFLALVCSLPLTFVFATILFYNEDFSKVLAGYLLKYVDDGLTETMSSMPKPLYPIIILVFAVFLFGGQLRSLYGQIEKMVLFIFDVPSKTDHLVHQFASQLLRKFGYQEAVRHLETGRVNPLPLAEELEHAPVESRLSFKLLHVSRSSVGQAGLHRTLVQVLQSCISNKESTDSAEEMDVAEDFSDEVPRSVNIARVFSGFVIYVMACAAFAAGAPLAAEALATYSSPIGWPSYKYFSHHVRDIVSTSVVTILPLVGGIAYLTKVASRGKTPIRTYAVVFMHVFFVAILFRVLDTWLVQVLAGGGSLDGFVAWYQIPEVVHTVSYSLVPGIVAVATAALPPGSRLNLKKVVFGGVVVGVGFWVSQFAFETVAHWPIRFFWYQGFQGLVLGFVGLSVVAIFAQRR